MIPFELPYETHILEYLPGTYGDFVCAIISYSTDGFFDPGNERWTRNEKYWKVNETAMLRNRYPLSCRGGGYEHVERYTEYMLSHRMYLDYPSFFTKEHAYKKILFNTHFKLSREFSEFNCRTLFNDFTKTKSKALTIATDFDSIFMAANNEYYTSVGDDSSDKVDWKHLLEKLQNILKYTIWMNKNIPSENRLVVKDILKFNPNDISSYGNIDIKKFNEYFDEYYKKKLSILSAVTRRNLRIMKNNKELCDMFEKGYQDVIRENT